MKLLEKESQMICRGRRRTFLLLQKGNMYKLIEEDFREKTKFFLFKEKKGKWEMVFDEERQHPFLFFLFQKKEISEEDIWKSNVQVF